MPVEVPELMPELDEFDLDIRVGIVELGDQPGVEIHASGSCSCSCGKTCTCYSPCSCQTCGSECTCASCSCTCDCPSGGCDDDDW
jgi:hypothetical protein